MEIKTFKKIFNDVLISMNLSKKGSYYYKSADGVTIVIGLQKSNYGCGYYINLGYIIKQLNPTLVMPRDVDGDVRARFGFKDEKGISDYFDLEKLSENDDDKLRIQIEDNIKNYVHPISSLAELRSFLQDHPVMLYQTKVVARQLMGFE